MSDGTLYGRYRHKPLVVEAFHWTGGDVQGLSSFVGLTMWTRADAADQGWAHQDDGEQIVVWNEAYQEHVQVPVGWWIIRGTRGVLWPLPPDLFAVTFGIVGEEA